MASNGVDGRRQKALPWFAAGNQRCIVVPRRRLVLPPCRPRHSCAPDGRGIFMVDVPSPILQSVKANDADVVDLRKKLAEMDAQIEALKSEKTSRQSSFRLGRRKVENRKTSRQSSLLSGRPKVKQTLRQQPSQQGQPRLEKIGEADDDDADDDDDSKRGSSSRHAVEAKRQPGRPQVQKADSKNAKRKAKHTGNEADDADDADGGEADDDDADNDDNSKRGSSSRHAVAAGRQPGRPGWKNEH